MIIYAIHAFNIFEKGSVYNEPYLCIKQVFSSTVTNVPEFISYFCI